MISWSTHCVDDSNEIAPELIVDLECDASRRRWKGCFSREFVETMTQKTGSAKRYDVFAKMLETALRSETPNDNLAIDIATYDDLEAMNMRRSRIQSVNESYSSRAGKKNEKRYLILTYISAFDRVQYPLPLSIVSSPTKAQLNRTIKRLRGEVKYLRKNFSSKGGRRRSPPSPPAVLSPPDASNSRITELRSKVQHLERELKRASEEMSS